MSLMNLFRPKWKHSDPLIRAKEIKTFAEQNQNIFLSVALNDPSEAVRLVAVNKLTDEDSLEKVIAKETSSEIVKILKNKLQTFYIKELNTTSDAQRAEELLKKIDSKDIFEELAQNASLPEVRVLCLSKITKESLLADIACQELEPLVAQKAAAKITKPELQEKLFNNAKSPAVREQMKPLLQARKQEKQLKQQNKVLQQKAKILSQALENIDESTDILSQKTSFTLLQEEAKTLDLDTEDKIQALVDSISSKINKAQETLDQEAASQKQEIEEISTLENFIQKLEATAITATPEELEEAISEFDTIAQPLSLPEEKKSAFKERAKRLLLSTQDKLEQLQAQNLENGQKQEALQTLLSQAVALAENTDFDGLGKKIKALKDNFKALNLSSDSFWEAIKASEERLTQHRSEQKLAYEEKTNRLEEIISKVEALDPEGDYDSTAEAIRSLTAQWHDIVGEEKNSFHKTWSRFKVACSPFQEMQQWEQWHNEQEKEHIVEEAEALLKSEDASENRFQALRTLQNKWKVAGNISHSRHQELVEKFRSICDQIMEQCQDYLSSKKQEREDNLTQKEALVAAIAPLLANENKWAESTQGIKDLQDKWKTIGPVPKEHNDRIWNEYRSACDAFFEKRRGFMKEQESSRDENLSQKETLCTEAEALQTSTDWNPTTQKLKDLQNSWKNIGPVPREKSDAIWKRFRLACDSFFENKRKHFESLDQEKKDNLALKLELCDKLEALLSGEISEATNTSVDELKEQWKTIGAVPRDDSDSIWERFCAAGDSYLDKQASLDPKLAERLKVCAGRKESIIADAKELIESNDWKGISNRLKELQNEWKELGRVGSQDSQLWKNFRAICDEFFARRRDQFEILEQNRINNLEAKELLLQEAQKVASEESSDEARNEIRQLRARWKEVGPVPKADADRVWEAFNKACDSLFQEKEA